VARRVAAADSWAGSTAETSSTVVIALPGPGLSSPQIQPLEIPPAHRNRWPNDIGEHV
jgi:hypothetical protein